MGGERSQHPAGCGGGVRRGRRRAPLGRPSLLPSSARFGTLRGPGGGGRSHTLTKRPAGRQDTGRDRHKTPEIPSAGPRHSVTPLSDHPIRSQCCMADTCLIQSYALSPGRGPQSPPPTPRRRLGPNWQLSILRRRRNSNLGAGPCPPSNQEEATQRGPPPPRWERVPGSVGGAGRRG